MSSRKILKTSSPAEQQNLIGHLGTKDGFGTLLGMVLFWAAVMTSAALSGNPSHVATVTQRRADYEQTSEIFRAFAQQGRPDAQFMLGAMYFSGEGVPQNFTAAVEWYRKAAKQGNRNACYSLGMIYARGLGLSRDLAQATEWYQKAAEQGHAAAQTALALQYTTGNGVTRDDAIAARWAYRAAVQGHSEAQIVLANMLASGMGVPKNHVVGYAWASIAERHATDEKTRDQSKALRDAIGTSMSPEQIEEAQKMAARWGPTLERSQQPTWDVTREQDGILTSLAVKQGEATVNWRFVRSTTAPLAEVNGTISGKALGVPQFEPYPKPGTSTYLLFLLDVSGATREAQIEQDKLTLSKIAGRAQEHHQIDAAIYAERLELLIPGEPDTASIVVLAKAAQPRAGNANLGQALLTAINIPSSAPAERRAIFVLTDGHSDDSMNASNLIENAKRTTTSLNFILSPSERSVDLAALEVLAEATGGLVVEPDQVSAFLESPFQLVDSGGTARFPLAYVRRDSQTDPKVMIAFKYGDRILELASTAVNESRLEREALTHVLDSCDASCTEDFRKQVQDRIDLSAAEEKIYQAAQDEPKRLREYVANCVACNFREEAEVRANALEEIAALAVEENVPSKKEQLPVSKRRHRQR